MTTGVIDKDPAHDLRRDTKEVRSIPPVDLALVDEADVHLMNKSRRLQGVVGPLVPKLARGNATEFPIDERQQLIEGSPAAATPVNKQRRDVRRCGSHYLVEGLKQQQDSGDDPANSSIPSSTRTT